MIKISRVDAYQGMDETDFSVMDDELHLCFNSDQRGDRNQSQEFYLDNKNNIILEVYWDSEKVHTVAFENKVELTEQGKMRLVNQVEQKKDGVIKNWEAKEMGKIKNTTEQLVLDLGHDIGFLSVTIEDLGHLEGVLNRMATDAKQMQYDKLDQYFLYDKNDTLQSICNLMIHLMGKLNDEYKKIDKNYSELLEKVRLNDKKSPTSGKTIEPIK